MGRYDIYSAWWSDKTLPPETMQYVVNQNEAVFMCYYQKTKQVVPEE